MAKISYGRSVKPVVKNNARTCRHMRRMLEAIECRKIEEILAAQFGHELPVRSAELNRAEICCKRVTCNRVSKATETETEYHRQIIAGAASYPYGTDAEGSVCLPQVALFRTWHGKVRNRRNA